MTGPTADPPFDSEPDPGVSGPGTEPRRRETLGGQVVAPSSGRPGAEVPDGSGTPMRPTHIRPDLGGSGLGLDADPAEAVPDSDLPEIPPSDHHPPAHNPPVRTPPDPDDRPPPRR